jgi:FkbM family methyltransferase
MQSIKRFLPFGFKRWVKESAAGMLNIPLSRFDVPLALLQTLPRKQRITLIDVGASTGSFTHTMDRYYGIRRALLIEPQPKRVESMKARLPADRFSVACAAVSSDEGTVEMDILNWDYSSSILPVRRDLASVTQAIDLGVREKIKVQTSTLDKMCATHGFDGFIDLLKIDVQGAESMVIAGAAEVLRRTGLI